MDDIFEVRIHGRGGQGAKTAGQFLAEAAMYEGKEIQAFPEYGPERRGAPVVSFVKISEKPIKAMTPIKHAEAIVIIDPTLLCEGITVGAKDDAIMIVNTKHSANDVRKITNFKGKICTVDATGISLDIIGVDTPNTPMLGAFVKATGVVSLEHIDQSITCKFLEKLGPEKNKLNLQAVKKAHDELKED